ncbi:DNA damage responsive protein [Cichlidogyrus casuarinus]|uniref:DNA damage responsive protein n=1 Tax=Cichlidogyrus casuarinus TaxID=1844966 RepID=A0ABD2QB88_9PLAT
MSLSLLLMSLLMGPVCQSQNIITNGKLQCEDILLDKLPEEAFTASSFLKVEPNPITDLANADPPITDYKPFSIRRRSDDRSSNSAWCPSNKVGSDLREFVQIDLGSLHVISKIQLRGLKERFARWIQIRYKREDSDQEDWRIYRTSMQNTTDLSESILEGQKSDRFPSLLTMDYPFVARFLRIYPTSGNDQVDSQKVCLSIVVYGCEHPGNLIEYSVRKGDYYQADRNRDPLGDVGSLDDLFYDGLQGNFKRGGLGKLADLRTGAGIQQVSQLRQTFVGWKMTDPLEISFKFSRIMNFTRVSLFLLVSDDEDARETGYRKFGFPSGVKMRFDYRLPVSRESHNAMLVHDLSATSSQPIGTESLIAYFDQFQARLLSLTLNSEHKCADHLTLTLDSGNHSWIVLSEVAFDNCQFCICNTRFIFFCYKTLLSDNCICSLHSRSDLIGFLVKMMAMYFYPVDPADMIALRHKIQELKEGGDPFSTLRPALPDDTQRDDSSKLTPQ